ncbi:MAG: hypothetical protein K2L27_04740 [Muribaculaceae bacterium]|nr:hypothetical protein [Muribaculaceae bacterium]
MKLNAALIFLTLLVAAAGCFALSSNRDYTIDDLLYRNVYGPHEFNDPRLLRPIADLSDVAESQAYHYMHVNGRGPVHVCVQIFDGILGYKAFGVANTIVFLTFIVLTVRYLAGSRWRRPWAWLLVVAAVLYMFPGTIDTRLGPWFAVAFALNYLWPAAMFMAVLLLRRHWGASARGGARDYIAAAIAGLLAGWSNEAFAIPLSAAFALYPLCVERRFPRGPSGVLTISLWVGTALVTFAPGTFSRMGEHGEDGLRHVLSTLPFCYAHARLFWVLLVSAGALCACRRLRIGEFVRAHAMLCFAWSTGVGMSVYAHTHHASLTCVELTSLLLTVRAWQSARIRLPRLRRLPAAGLYMALLALLAAHIGAVARADRQRYAIYTDSMHTYLSSPDGVYALPQYPAVNTLLAGFVDQPHIGFHPYSYCTIAYAAYAGRYDRLPVTLSPADYDALINHPERLFEPSRRVPGTAGMYRGEGFYFRPLDDCRTDSMPVLEADFSGLNPSAMGVRERIVQAIRGSRPGAERLRAFVLHTRRGAYLAAFPPYAPPTSVDTAGMQPQISNDVATTAYARK